MNEENIKEEGMRKPSVSGSLIALGGIIVLIILSLVVPAKWLGVKPVIHSNAIDFSKIKPVTAFTKDGDNDGQLSWRELVESTTNGTSTILDATTLTPDPKIAKALNDPNNLTASFSKNLVVSSAYLKNNNITDPEAQQQVMDGITGEEIAKTASKKYLYGDLKLTDKEDRVTLHTYGNEMAKIIDVLITQKNLREDFPGVGSYLETGDEKTLAPIQADAKRVNDLVQKLLAITVPRSASVYHLIVLNQIVLYRDSITNLSVVATDPVRATISVQKYPEIMLDTLRSYKKLADYFILKNVIFTAQEPGYIFTIGYTLK